MTTQKLITQEKKLSISDKNVSQARAKPRKNRGKENTIANLSHDDIRAMISTNAYYRALARDFSPEEPESDWLAAENEINGMLGNKNYY